MASPGPRRSPRHLPSVESPSEAYCEDALVGQMLPRPPGGECPLVDDFLNMTYAPRDLVEAVVKLGGKVQRVMLKDLGKEALLALVGSSENALVQSNKAHKHLAVVKSIVTVSFWEHCGRPPVQQDIPILALVLAKYAQRYTLLKRKWGLSRPPIALLPLNQAGTAPSGGEHAAPAPRAAAPLAAARRMSFGSLGFVDEGVDEGASSLFGRPSGDAPSVGGGAFLDDGQGDEDEPQEPDNVDPHAKKKINWSTPMHIRLLHVARSQDVVNQSRKATRLEIDARAHKIGAWYDKVVNGERVRGVGTEAFQDIYDESIVFTAPKLVPAEGDYQFWGNSNWVERNQSTSFAIPAAIDPNEASEDMRNIPGDKLADRLKMIQGLYGSAEARWKQSGQHTFFSFPAFVWAKNDKLSRPLAIAVVYLWCLDYEGGFVGGGPLGHSSARGVGQMQAADAGGPNTPAPLSSLAKRPYGGSKRAAPDELQASDASFASYMVARKAAEAQQRAADAKRAERSELLEELVRWRAIEAAALTKIETLYRLLDKEASKAFAEPMLQTAIDEQVKAGEARAKAEARLQALDAPPPQMSAHGAGPSASVAQHVPATVYINLVPSGATATPPAPIARANGGSGRPGAGDGAGAPATDSDGAESE